MNIFQIVPTRFLIWGNIFRCVGDWGGLQSLSLSTFQEWAFYYYCFYFICICSSRVWKTKKEKKIGEIEKTAMIFGEVVDFTKIQWLVWKRKEISVSWWYGPLIPVSRKPSQPLCTQHYHGSVHSAWVPGNKLWHNRRWGHNIQEDHGGCRCVDYLLIVRRFGPLKVRRHVLLFKNEEETIWVR